MKTVLADPSFATCLATLNQICKFIIQLIRIDNEFNNRMKNNDTEKISSYDAYGILKISSIKKEIVPLKHVKSFEETMSLIEKYMIFYGVSETGEK